MLAPIEVAAIDHDTGDSGTVATDPFSGTVDDDVGAVFDGLDEVAASAESVIDLGCVSLPSCLMLSGYKIINLQ